MKEAFWGYFIIVLGMFVIVVLLLVQNLTTTNEESFYLTREVLESSMVDAVDYGSYRLTGRVVMSSEKFQEVFIRRFAESVTNNKSYTIEFYDIYEDPPKATVRIRTSGGTAEINSDEFGITVDTILSGILETKLLTKRSEEVELDPEPEINETIPITVKEKVEDAPILDDFCLTDMSSDYCKNLEKEVNEYCIKNPNTEHCKNLKK